MFLIILTLVLYQTDLNFGHTIPELKNNHEASNVYELNENNSTSIRIVNPKSELPKLTEIIYYHIIEKPYGDQVTVEESTDVDDGPDFDDTRRPFTNGHGYQYTKSEIGEDDDEEKAESEESEETSPDDTIADEAYYDDDSKEDKVTEKSNNPSTEKDEFFGEGILDDATTEIPDTSFEEFIADETTEKDIEPTTERDEVTEMGILEDDVTTEIPDATTSKPETTTFKADVLEKKKQARNQLFNTVRNKYQKLVKHDKLVRRKREADMNEIPEAPVLPELDFKILPDDIREQIEKAMTEINNKPKSDNLNKPEDQNFNIEKDEESEENIQDVIEKNLDEFLTNLSSSFNSGDDEDSEDSDVTNHQIDELIKQVDENTDEIDKHSDHIDDAAHFDPESQRIIPRTYGMNLNGDNGYVWNDLYTNPGIYFDVGEDAEKHEREIQPLTDNRQPEKVTDTTSHPDLEDIHVNIHKEHTTALPHINQPNKVETSEEKNTKETDSFEKHKEPHSETNTDHTDKIREENNEEMQTRENENEEHAFDSEDDGGKLDHGKSKNIEKLEEILQDEKFSKWLAEWTATYMELLTKYIKQVVKEEIVNHEKSLAHDKDKVSEDRIESKEIIKKSDENSKNLDEANNKNTDESPTVEATTDEASTDKAPTDEAVTKKSDETEIEPTIEDNKLVIEGKEIPITHTTNFKDESETEEDEPLLKKRKDKDDTISHRHPSNKTEPKENLKENSHNSIKAMNIYGNSMNNEKVTNVYIFLKNLDTKGIEALKPIINGDNSQEKSPINTLVIGNADKINVATNTDSKLEKKEESSHSVDSTTKTPSEKHEISTEKPTTTTETAKNKEISTTEASTEKVLQDKTDIINTTENSKENDNNKVLEPQKSEDDKVTENNNDSTTLVPGSDELKGDKLPQSHNSEENDKASENKDSVEKKSETTTVVPVSDKIEEVEKVTVGPTSTTIEPADNKKETSNEESTTESKTTTVVPGSEKIEEVEKVTEGPNSTTIEPEEREVEKTETVADDKKETSIEESSTELPGDSKKEESS